MPDALLDPEYVLRGVSGPAFGRSYRLLSPTVLGRAPECDISISSPGLSRKHARLRPTLDGLVIEDLDSTNGSFLNGQRVAAAIARPGDEIAFDLLRFRLGGSPLREEAAPAGRGTGGPSRHRLAKLAIAALVVAALAALSGW